MDNAKKLKQIENLIVGSGAEDFRELENITNVFCPFEAIGMVQQEIRHSAFLSFALDENRPHGFGTKLLEELLTLIAERVTNVEVGFSRLDLHFMDISNSSIYREWRNIDLLVEIPKKKGRKGIILTIELKIHASESLHQLAKYKDTIDAKYPEGIWERIFVFLTLNEDAPSGENAKHWIPIGLKDFIERLETAASINNFQGKSADLLVAYTKMMRREHMENKELETIARKIWSKHKEALNTLREYEPDLRGEVMEILYKERDEIAIHISNNTGFEIFAENSSSNNIRFCLADWKKYPTMMTGDKTWLDSDHLMAIELMKWGHNKVRISFVIGPGVLENRETIFEAVLNSDLKIGRKTPVAKTRHKHLSAKYVLDEKTYDTAEKEDESAEELAKAIKTAVLKFLKNEIPRYDKIIKNCFGITS